MPIFTLQQESGKLEDIEILKSKMIIGRNETCEIKILGGDISREHACVTIDKDNCFIDDLDSRNGTYVNATPITEKTKLKHMDVVQIGKNTLMYSDNDISVESEKYDHSAPVGQSHSQLFNFDFLQEVIFKLEGNIGKIIKGKTDVIKNLIIALLSDGHILIEDVPGVGKSMLARVLAKSILGNYRRIQFSPDMLPSDITGINVYNKKTKDFTFMPGPIFGNIILADEINRTTPRTQSSLLECMSEATITIDGQQHVLPKPFFVIATQNPSDYHGTYPLPKPQLDRFLMKISVGYPEINTEKEILSSQMERHPINEISHIVKAMDIVLCQALVRKTYVSDVIREYIVKIVNATRNHPAIEQGGSPRASLALMRTSQTIAAYNGRDFVVPNDVRNLTIPVLAHRLTFRARARNEWDNVETVIESIVDNTQMPEEHLEK
ncbi:MAG: AAA family ATPase [Verrucomicrobiota bacterium]|nr:AAA family ATPase [Verrucomicrobiota bacterium]